MKAAGIRAGVSLLAFYPAQRPVMPALPDPLALAVVIDAEQLLFRNERYLMSTWLLFS